MVITSLTLSGEGEVNRRTTHKSTYAKSSVLSVNVNSGSEKSSMFAVYSK